MNVDECKSLIESSSKIVALTGAGVSTDSGIPDFQSVEDNWEYELDRAEMMSLSYFQRNPVKFWEMYLNVFNTVDNSSPNRFHYFLASLQNHCDVSVITQNVDGFHSLAGSSSVVELHGNRRFAKCSRNSCNETVLWSDVHMLSNGGAPRCGKCNKYMRPDTVLFGESVRDFDAAASLVSSCDLLIVAGTSLNVSPVSELPFMVDYSRARSLWLNNDSFPEVYNFTDSFVGSLSDFVDDFVRG